MLRHAIAPSSAYTKVSHSVVRNPRLNSDAKILLVYLQGLPESAATAKPLGGHAVDLGMKPRAYQRAKEALTACGYLHEWRWQGGRGRWITEQLITNVTLTRDEATAVRDGDRSPTVPFPTVGGPGTRELGGSPTDEDGEKNTPHPPTEEPPESPESPRSEHPDEAEAPAATEVPLAGTASGEGAHVARAERLLLSLRHENRDLLLGVREARGLAALAAEWLCRGVSPGDLRHALTARLPRGGVRSAAGFLRYRLVEKLPPEPGEAWFEEAPGAAPGALVECEGPGEAHVFRPVGDETRCGSCRREGAPGARGPEHRPGRAADWRERVAEAFAERPGLAWSALDRPAGPAPSGG
ncbi:hypothetical protein [Streptomyces sp. NPDC058758]|uniref:hypothetical protein n=1 Tax=Streptomyces sp. NPDC058758 TaxID=3346627 RepID=UPI0036B2D0C2